MTTDAMGCQKDIAKIIVEGKGDYVLAVKDNQPTFHAEIQAAFAEAEAKPKRLPREYVTQLCDHGRSETRRVRVLSAAGRWSSTCLESWVGLLTLVMGVRVVVCKATGVLSKEVSYFISSLDPKAEQIGGAIRGHWSIENGLHWVFDVVFREDARRVDDRTAAEKSALLNRLALSVLRGDTSKGSLKVKRKRAGWSIQSLAQLLGFPSE
ncbi:MAG: ISAs1 family transposase [Terracidiphilus sp.]